MPQRIRRIRGARIDIALTEADLAVLKAVTPVSVGPTTYYNGYLRDHMTLYADGSIKTRTFYGGWVEQGCAKFAGRFFVARSIPRIAMSLKDRVARQLDEAKLLNLPKKR